jgi:Secretion system C-terminal sorting domain
MQKLLFLTLFSCVTPFLLKAQNGGGCKNAITVTPGIYTVDSMIKGAASFSQQVPYPTKAKWYKFSPSQDGLLNVSSCGGGADSRLFMYVGNCDTLKLFGYNDDFCLTTPSGDDEGSSDISKFVKAGKTYFIEWDNAWDTVRFNFSLSFSPNAIVREAQACQSAKTISVGTIKVDSLFGYASHGDAARANWYKYTPRTNGKIALSTCGNDIDTRLYVYKGDCTSLTTVAEGDDECDGTIFADLAVAVQDIAVTANTTYYFEWDDSHENEPFEFTFTFDALASTQDETLSKSITLAPNPASDYVDINFDFEKFAKVDVKIFNTVGQTVLSKKIDSILRGVEKLDISDLKPGIYIVQIVEGLRKSNKKLVINR